MAVTGIWKITKRLDRVIKYTTNIDKVKGIPNEKDYYYELHNIKDYDDVNFNTEEQLYISGINCSQDIAYDEMMITKEQYGKTSGILGFHAFQSFAEGEVSPRLAHKIGIELAQEMWGDRFEVVVSTHINTNHIHNHFVINSVSFKDGKRYYDKRETYAELRKISDSLCEEYGLSVIKEKSCSNSKINYDNYFKGTVQNNNYYVTAKVDLDRAIGMAYSYTDFERLLRAMDYELIYRGNKLSIRRSPYKKNIRIHRYFGDDYSIERIKERIDVENHPRVPFIEEYSNKQPLINKNVIKSQKKKGIYAMCLYYCYLLKVFPSRKPYQKIPPSMRADIDKMEKISEEVRLLAKNELKTDQQFFLFKEKKETELNKLMDKRSKLWYRHKKSKSKEEKENILQEIKEINKKITPLRREVRLCDGIEERIPKIERNLQKLNDDIMRKEVEKNESIK